MALNREIAPARWGSAGAPVVVSGAYKTGESIIKGSVLTIDANGELVVATSSGAAPADATVAGIALESAGSKPGFSMGQVDVGGTSVYTGRVQQVSYAVANRVTVWSGVISGDGTTVTAPTQTLVGESYKLTKASNGIWYVDSTDQSPANVTIVKIDDFINIIYFVLTTAALQI